MYILYSYNPEDVLAGILIYFAFFLVFLMMLFYAIASKKPKKGRYEKYTSSNQSEFVYVKEGNVLQIRKVINIKEYEQMRQLFNKKFDYDYGDLEAKPEVVEDRDNDRLRLERYQRMRDKEIYTDRNWRLGDFDDFDDEQGLDGWKKEEDDEPSPQKGPMKDQISIVIKNYQQQHIIPERMGSNRDIQGSMIGNLGNRNGGGHGGGNGGGNGGGHGGGYGGGYGGGGRFNGGGISYPQQPDQPNNPFDDGIFNGGRVGGLESTTFTIGDRFGDKGKNKMDDKTKELLDEMNNGLILGDNPYKNRFGFD